MKAVLLLILLVTNIALAEKNSSSKMPTYQPKTIMVRMKAFATIENVRKALSPFGAVPVRQMLQPLQSFTYSLQANRRQSLSSSKLKDILDAESPVLRTFVVHFEAIQTPQKYCSYLMNNCPEVEIAEPSIIEQTLSTPNDAFATQQNLLGVIHAFEAWDISKGDASVIIGICDNGIYQDHEDITNSIAINTGEIPDNGIDDDNNGIVDDYRGANITSADDATKPGNTFCNDSHGSSVAGIAGATTDNTIGIAGVGYKCKIFPIKTGYLDKVGVFAGYEGLIYAAVRGFKVVNCSWGSPNSYSKINESIIKYVQSRDVAIVVAAGNNTGILPWYPAGYDGVLGVGETFIADDATQGAAIGAHSVIMAPGNAAITTTNDQGGYTQNFGGSSASAPIVSGVVAVVRAYYPELTARQALEHVRLTADNIEKQNSMLKGLIAGRVNMLRALTEKPTSHPALRPVSWDLRVRGNSTSQFFSGDTVSLSITVKNHLAASGIVISSLSVKEQFFPFILIDSVVLLDPIPANGTANIATFRFIIPEENSELTFLRINLSGSNYSDYFLIPFHPTSDIATFSNDSISVSLGDMGQFGFAGEGVTWRGIGLSYGEYGNFLYYDSGTMPDHCFIVTDGNNRLESVSVTDGDFMPSKKFTTPEPTVSIMSDSSVDISTRIGVEIKRSIAMAPGNVPAFKIRYAITNVSGAPITDISLGQYLDVDIGAYGFFNYARPLTEAIPSGISGAAEIIGRDQTFEIGGGKTSTFPMLGCLVLPVSANGIPQMAGVEVGEFMPDGLTTDKKIALINSGTALQATVKGDIGLASGMKFPGEFPNGETRIFDVCYCTGMSKETIAATLKVCAEVNSVDESLSQQSGNWVLMPNPTEDEFLLRSTQASIIPTIATVVNSLGERLLFAQFQGSSATISTRNLPSGVYYVQIQSGSNRETVKLIVLH